MDNRKKKFDLSIKRNVEAEINLIDDDSSRDAEDVIVQKEQDLKRQRIVPKFTDVEREKYSIITVPKEVRDQIMMELKILAPLLPSSFPSADSTKNETGTGDFPGASLKPNLYSNYRAKITNKGNPNY